MEHFFRKKNVTRAEVAAMFARISNITNSEPRGGIYSDVPSTHWASGFIQKVSKELNLFNGYPDGTFHPNSPMTRAELTIVITKFMKTGAGADATNMNFTDVSTHWAKSFIEQAFRYKIITGYSDNTFRPDEFIKRSEMVTMVNKMQYRGPLSVQTPNFPDVPSNYWAYGQIEEAAVNHSFYRDENGNEIMAQ